MTHFIQVHASPGATGTGTYVQGLAQALHATGARVIRTQNEKRERIIFGKRVGGYLSQIPQNWLRKSIDGCDVHHAACNWSLGLRADSVMVHDLNPLVMREMVTARCMFRLQQRLLRSKVLLAPSQATREGLMRWLRIEPERVHVAPHGIDHRLFHDHGPMQPPGGLGLNRPYLVYAGDYRPYKRIEEGIQQASLLGWGFVRVGPPATTPYARTVQALGQCLLGDAWQDLGYVPRDLLPYVYSGAEAMWFPSRWEGFGLPPLEAAACGTPSILADSPVMREVHGELGIYVNGAMPSREDIEAAQRPADLVRHARRYTWRRSAEAHLEAWRAGGLIS